MGKERVFSTPRQPALTGDQMLENLINKRNAQRANMNALAEATKLEQSVPDFTATMESSMQQTEEGLRRTAAMENLAYSQGTKNIALARLGLKQRMITEGAEYVRGKVFGELVYESYWLDDAVKESATEEIQDTIEETLCYIEDNFSGSRVTESKQSVLLKNLNVVIEETVKKATERICKECESDDSVFPEFSLTDAEESELDEKLIDLGRDEIVDLIKSKVAQVVQDEKEKGQERADLFREIDEMTADEENSEEETTETEESVNPEVLNGKAITEGQMYRYALSSTNFTANERHMASLMESGVDIRLLDDPSWGEFKSFVSMMCKSIKSALCRGINIANPEKSCAEKYVAAKCLIEDLEKKLSDVPETVPGDVKEFVMAMVSSIYGAVPPDRVIISRFGNPMGSPDLKSEIPAVNMATVSWTDLFVNIKTNLSAIKSYCDDQMNPDIITQDDVNGSECPVSGKNSLAQLTATAQTRILAKNIGGSLFESMMLGCISSCTTSAMESNLQISDDNVENAALIESILKYTIFEALDTIGLYKFRKSDVDSMKRDFMKPVSESRSIIMSGGRDKKGKKKVRINTRKMKRKKDINGNIVS